MARNSSQTGSRKRKRPPNVPGTSCDEHLPRSKLHKIESLEVDRTVSTSSLSPVASNGIGTIQKILMKNFMCHSHLEFTFGSRVNFIIGRNGSGKSAVLTAVMAGLGGKASVTNRGSKISSLIQKGRPSARIEVTLSNTGPEAYKPELFGPTITIVRILRPVGGSYEIRAHDRRMISTKREDLQHIMSHMNVQVDNPIVVLNQETSRNFLQSKSAKDKYVFFLKATQLEVVKANYEEAEENAKQAKSLFESKRTALPHLESEVKKHEAILKLVENIAASRSKLELLKAELCWCKVIANENRFFEAKQHFEKVQEQLRQFERNKESSNASIKKATVELKQRNDELTEIVTNKSSKLVELDNRKRLLEEVKRKFRESEEKEKKIRRNIRCLEADKVTLENEIERAKGNSNEEWKKEKERRAKEIAIIEEKLSATRSQEIQASRAEQEARANVKKKDSGMRELGAELKKFTSSCQKISYQIQTAQASKSNAVNRFGARTADILREIANERRFRVKPKGPVGSFLHLKDDRWAYAVERHCSRTLTAFMVDNNDDAKLLKRILDKNGQGNVTIFTKKFINKRYDCHLASPVSKSCCFIDVIDIKDSDVFNLLVDVHSINQVLLFDNVELALSILKRVETVPRNCSIAIDSEYNRVNPAPKYRILSNDRPQHVQFLKRACEPLPELHAELKRLRECEADTQKSFRQTRKELVVLEDEVRKAHESRSKLSAEDARFEAQLRELRNFEEPVVVNVSLLEDEIVKLSAAVEAKRSDLPAAEEELQALLEQVREKSRAVKEIGSMIAKDEERTSSLKATIKKCHGRIEKLEEYGGTLNCKMEAFESTAAQREAEVDLCQQLLDASMKTALENFPERIQTKRTQSALERELETLTEQISNMECTQPDPERTKESYRKLKEKYDTLSTELRDLKNYLAELSHLIDQRTETLIKVRDLACFRVNTIFQSLMSSENLNATLVFEHEERKLQIDVKETSNNVRHSQRDVRGLSGGERSFSTVCFICALWSSTDYTPFRVLDEFDIFMDMSKRRKSLQMLLEVCQKQSRCQFIFLTPLEMPNIDALKAVKILMMPEPERGSIGSH